MNVRQFEEERQQREQKLKEEIERLQTKNGELNVFLQQRTTDGWGEHVVDVAMKHIEKVEEENKRLREALELYADEKLWSEPYVYTDLVDGEPEEVKDAPWAILDGGDYARKALKGDNNDTT